mgnify:CR=1 FL=1
MAAGWINRFVTIGLLASGLALSAMMGGCQNNKNQLAEAEAEAAELRQRNAQIEQSLRERDATIAELQRAQMAAQQQAAQQAVTGGGAPRSGGNTGTGFEGESGVSAERTGEGIVVSVAGEVLFASGSADLKPSARQALDRIANTIKSRYSSNSIRVEGHTDSDPIRRSKWGSNQALSEARAQAVERYLGSRGISTGRISAVGMGSTRPKATKAASRRVEIVILGA